MAVVAPKPTWSNDSKPDEIMREVRKAFEDLASQVSGIPVGGVYVQFPGQDTPKAIFGGTWLNITSMYEGLFFRAEGGDALAFNGGTQDWDAGPHYHLTGIGSTAGDDGLGIYDTVSTGTPGAGTKVIQASSSAPARQFVTSITYARGAISTASETRPVNQSIRIWKRSA